MPIGFAAPLTGVQAWGGAATRRGAELAVMDLNSAGGALEEQITMVVVDDHCAADQAIAAAEKLVAAGVLAVFGHECSGAALPASEIYAAAGIVMISNFATNPRLTERGLGTIFRLAGRDDLQGALAADLLAERFGHRRIAIVHDGEAFGQGLAEETRARLRQRGMSEAMFHVLTPGAPEFSDLIRDMREAGVEVVYYAGYVSYGALLLRQAQDGGYRLQMVASDGIATTDFALMAGEAAAGTLFTFPPAPATDTAETAALAARIDPDLDLQSAFNTYASIQAWAQAVEKAGTYDPPAVADALRAHEFDTVLGTIGFNEKGDVTGYEPFTWYIWTAGEYVPLEETPVSD